MSLPMIPVGVPIQIHKILGDGEPIRIQAEMVAATAACPTCHHRSQTIHQHYWRQIQDLPWQGIPVVWQVWCRKFRCDNTPCRQQIFCERLPTDWVAPYGRRTQRVRSTVLAWGWTASAAEVARVAATQGIPVSPDTLNRWIRSQTIPTTEPLRVVGLDEWAKRKGQTYATIVVDQERHRIVEVLPDDRPETVAAWLHTHPEIQIITRDRDRVFAQAIEAGAPTAQQIADRFHLLQNLQQVVTRSFTRHRPSAGVGSPATGDPPDDSVPQPPTPGQLRRQNRWTQVRALAHAGHSMSAIARLLDLDRTTVRIYAMAETCPEPPPRRPSPRGVAAWSRALDTLWTQGIHQTAALWQALRAQGYQGSERSVRRWATRRRQHLPSAEPVTRRFRRVAPQTLAHWCCQRGSHVSRPAGIVLTRYLTDPQVQRVYWLSHLFQTMVKYRRPQALEGWLHQAEASGIPEFARFAAGLRRDHAAVSAALREGWSQGITEGFNHKIKRIKRLMYGRANFDLLRARILHPSI